MADFLYTADVDTSKADKSLNAFLGRAERGYNRLGLSGAKSLRPLGEGLSAATANASEFDKSLTAANARVLAFGASAGLIIKVQQAMGALVKTTIDVEKRLKDINVVLETDSKSLAKFGDSLFRIAKETGQSFDVVAEAATELSRQGLTIEKTLQRAKDAMILTRLSGLDAASSVEALTASLNTFNDVGISSTVIVNKLAKVDAAFAVSSADLAEALKRVGASAQGAGVGIDELLAIVTAAQQKTARGGSVIGNSFKTIFTRIQRPEVLNQLEELGVAVRTVSGDTLPAIRILKSLADTYDKLGPAQKSLVSEQVAGVFQINILKSALSDLNSEYSIYNQAVLQSATATNEAIMRNEALNTTMAALLNKTVESSKNFASTVGGISLAPTIRKVLSGVNEALESGTLSAGGEDVGASWGKGLLTGLGKFIGGPGALGVTLILGKLIKGFATFGYDALKAFLGANSAAAQQKQIQEGVLNILRTQPGVLKAVMRGQLSVNDVAERYLHILDQENRALMLQTSLADQIGSAMFTKGASVSKNAAGAASIVPPRSPSFSLAHTPKSAGGGGIIPNFAKTPDEILANAINSDRTTNLSKIVGGASIGGVTFSAAHIAKAQEVLARRQSTAAASAPAASIPLNSPAAMVVPYARQGSIESVLPTTVFNYKDKEYKGLRLPVAGLDSAKVDKSNDAFFDKKYIIDGVVDRVSDLTSQYARALSPVASPSNIPSKQSLYKLFETGSITDPSGKTYNIGGVKGVSSAAGSAFEAATTLALQLQSERMARSGKGDFDVRGAGAYNKLGKVFSIPSSAAGLSLADFKISESSDGVSSMGKKIRSELATAKGLRFPNFSALSEAIARERSAGIPSSAIRVGKSASLVSASNPSGLAVYNTIDEPRGLSQGINRYKTAGLNPKVAGMPNFANKVYSSSPTGNPFGVNIGQLVQQYMQQSGMKPSPMRVTQADVLAPPQPNPIRVSAHHIKRQGSTYWPDPTRVNPATARPVLPARPQPIRVTSGIPPQRIPMGVNPTTASMSEPLKNYNKHANNVIRRFIKQDINLEKANKSLEDLAKYYSISKQKQQRQTDRLLKTQDSMERASKKQLEKHKSITGAKTKSPLSLGRLGIGAFGAQMLVSSLAGKYDQNEFLRVAEGGIQGASSGGTLGASLGPQMAIVGAVTGGIVGTLNTITDSYKLSVEKNRKAQEDAASQLNTFTGVFNEGDQQKIVEAFNQLPKSIQDSIGGVDKLSKETLAAAQNIAKSNVILTNFRSSYETASQVSSFYNLKSKTSDFSSIMSYMGANFGVNMPRYSGKQKEDQEIKKKRTEAVDSFVKQIMSSGFGGKPLAASLAEGDLDTIFSGKDTFGLVKNISDKEKLNSGESLALINALGELKRLPSDLGAKSSAKEQIKIYNKFAKDKAKDEATSRDLAQTLLELRSLSSGYSLSGLGLQRGGSGPRIYSQYGALPPSQLKGLSTSSIGRKNLTSKGRQDVSDIFTSLQDVAKTSSGSNIPQISELITSGKYKEAVTILGQISADTPEALRNIEEVRLKLLQIQEENTVGGILGRNFRFDTQDQFDFLLDRVDKVSSSMKSSFGDAFNSFATGAESASDAFRNFALSVVQNLSRMATDYMTNQLFGLLGGLGRSIVGGGSGNGNYSLVASIFSSGATKKARGGMVHGGSGVRDDVPALLTGGEYVVRKSAVDSLGVGFLDNINRYADGGLVLDNQFSVGSGKNRGSFNVSKRLSYLALTDTNNPQNALRNELNEQDLARIQSIEDYESRKNAAMSAYRKKKRQTLIGGYIQAGAAIGMGAIQGGLENYRYRQNPTSYGGQGPATKRATEPFLFYKHRQYGGLASSSISPVKPISNTQMQSSASNDMLIAAINNLSMSMTSKGGGGDLRIQEAGAQTNNINITVNVSENGSVDASVDNSNQSQATSSKDKNNQDRRQEKELGMMIKNVVVQTITEQKRPGGLLDKVR